MAEEGAGAKAPAPSLLDAGAPEHTELSPCTVTRPGSTILP